MSPDASALLAWFAGRGGSALQRDIGDTAPRRFRRASIYGPLVAELLAARAIVETGARPRSFAVVGPAPVAAPSPSGSGVKLRAMLDDAAAELGDVPDGLASFWAAVTVRDEIVARLLASKGLAVDSEYARAARAVDDAVVLAFGCELA